MLNLKTIFSKVNCKLIWGIANVNINSFSIDTRTLKKNDVFVAIKGSNFNGHDFILEAVKKGAIGIICSKKCFNSSFKKVLEGKNNLKFILYANNTVKILGEIANIYRNLINPYVIAITGSVGKTTTKDFLYKVLSYKFKVYKTKGTQNNLLGVPLNILRVPGNCDILILELGTNKKGEISELSKICQPNLGIITNIGPSHLEYLNSLKQVKKEKLSLVKHTKNDGCVFINSDFISSHEVKTNKKIITFGIKNDADYKAKDIKLDNKGIHFKIYDEKFNVKFYSLDFLYNVLICISVAHFFSFKMQDLRKIVKSFKFSNGRFNKIKLGDIMLIDDSYNSNPVSSRSAIESFSHINGYKRKLLVFGDMLELGKYACYYHKNIGKLIANKKIDFIFLLGKFSKYVRQGAISSGMSSDRIRVYQDKDCLIQELNDFIKKGDIILLKGSRGMEMEKVVRNIIKNKKLNKGR